MRAAYFLGRTQEAVVDIAGLELTAVQVRGRGFVEGEKLPVSIAADAIIPLVTADGAAPLPLPTHQGAARPASLPAHA